MSTSPAFREWASERIHAALDRDTRLANRLNESVRRGLPAVAVHATPQPAVGTLARRHWEVTCDKCATAPSAVFVVQPVPLSRRDGRVQHLLFNAGLCAVCADVLDVPAREARPSIPADPAIVGELSALLSDPADFTTFAGEPAEHLELALEQLADQGGAR
ncbi:hypothetical protein HDA30_000390 [Micrococcus cohnii]|uniref:Uncharacterized protein n=1 Tax=Micrococcus cohnii TaxID=993416 RepID=A0A7W7M2E1_9MICC|nr:hypothetical protein [Micrococcus cohnii]MBB4734882.1 hypothetical protein [Micrococcus cohnii]